MTNYPKTEMFLFYSSKFFETLRNVSFIIAFLVFAAFLFHHGKESAGNILLYISIFTLVLNFIQFIVNITFTFKKHYQENGKLVYFFFAFFVLCLFIIEISTVIAFGYYIQ